MRSLSFSVLVIFTAVKSSGKGHITEALCEKSYWVTAIELDRSLYGNLINKFKSKNNVTLINKDFLNCFINLLSQANKIIIQKSIIKYKKIQQLACEFIIHM